MGRVRYIKYTRRALYVNYILSIKGTTYLSSYKCAISCTALLNAAAESIPYATRCSARNAHLAQNAAKCCKNAGKFFPDVRSSNHPRRTGCSRRPCGRCYGQTWQNRVFFILLRWLIGFFRPLR